MSPAAIRRLCSKQSSKVCVFTGLRREAIWTDNLAQVVRWAADSARLQPDDHGLVLSTYTTLGGQWSGSRSTRMTEASDHVGETFRRNFRVREFENVCVLHLAEDFNPDDSDALSLLSAGVGSMVRAGVRGFVFDLTQFSHRVDLEESLGHLVRCMVPVIRNRGVLNWLRGSIFVQEWKVLKLLGVPPDNFETEQEAVEGLQTVLKAAHIRTDLAHRIVNSGVSIKHIAKVAGLFASDVRRIAEGVEEPADRVALLISSTLDSLSMQKSSTRDPEGAA